MYTEGVLAQTTQTNLKDLIETAGRVFPNGNNDCLGLIIQIDSEALGTVEVIGANSASNYGHILSNNEDVGPNFMAFRCSRVEHVTLKSSDTDTLVRVTVETVG